MSQSSRQRCGQHVTQYVAFLSTKHVVISFDSPVSHFFLYFHVQTSLAAQLATSFNFEQLSSSTHELSRST
jgi:hypothetical protein